mgnify:CR=1 FL=1
MMKMKQKFNPNGEMRNEKLLLQKVKIDKEKNGEVYNDYTTVYSREKYKAINFTDEDAKKAAERLTIFWSRRECLKEEGIPLLRFPYRWETGKDKQFMITDGTGHEPNFSITEIDPIQFHLFVNLSEPPQYFQEVSKFIISYAFSKISEFIDTDRKSIPRTVRMLDDKPFARLVRSLDGRQLSFLIKYGSVTDQYGNVREDKGPGVGCEIRRIAEAMGKMEIRRLTDYMEMNIATLKAFNSKSHYLFDEYLPLTLLNKQGGKIGEEIASALSGILNKTVAE